MQIPGGLCTLLASPHYILDATDVTFGANVDSLEIRIEA
jgi:hypothetical protein